MKIIYLKEALIGKLPNYRQVSPEKVGAAPSNFKFNGGELRGMKRTTSDLGSAQLAPNITETK